jgi:hypothetical protein
MRDYRRADRIRAAICVTLCASEEAMTVPALVGALTAWGLPLGPHANKTVSDATRTAVSRNQIRRVGRGRYVGGRIPPSTLYYMRVRVDRYVADPTRPYSRPDNHPRLPATEA